jgi:predicted transposase YbfD/YdcC
MEEKMPPPPAHPVDKGVRKWYNGDMEKIKFKKIKIETLRRKIQAKVRDPRRQYGNLLHKLWEMLVIALCSVISMGEDYDDMEEFGKEREKWLKEELGLELENGIPSGDTFRRLFERLRPKEFRMCLEESAGYVRTPRDVVNIDGKAKKSGGIHVISAFVGASQLTLGEIKSETKRGEIKEIPKLIDMIDVKGHIVTIDSIGCQREIVDKLVTKKVGADYVICLKGNQKNLHKAVEEHFMYNPVSNRSAKKNVYEAGHGRVEQREYWLETDISWLAQREGWSGLRSVGMAKSIITRKVQGREETSFEVRYFITSLSDVEEFAHSVREHWAIENKLHWSLDVVLREDGDLVKKGNAPLNMNVLDKFALYLVTQVDLGKISRKRKRYRAALNPDLLLSMVLCAK